MRSIGFALVLILSGCAAPTIESSTPPSPPSEASPSPIESRSPGPISRDDAVDLARRAVQDEGANWQIVQVQAGPLGEVRPGWEDLERGQGPSADLPVWRVVMAAGELSAQVVIDSRDGSVVSAVIGIVN